MFTTAVLWQRLYYTNPTLKHAWQREAPRHCTGRFNRQTSMILNKDWYYRRSDLKCFKDEPKHAALGVFGRQTKSNFKLTSHTLNFGWQKL